MVYLLYRFAISLQQAFGARLGAISRMVSQNKHVVLPVAFANGIKVGEVSRARKDARQRLNIFCSARNKRFCYTNKIICKNRDNKNILSQQQNI